MTGNHDPPSPSGLQPSLPERSRTYLPASWSPQVHKLYGHGNDVYCVAASRDGRYVASGCVAKSAAAAEVWVWAVGTWRGVAQLPVSLLLLFLRLLRITLTVVPIPAPAAPLPLLLQR